MLWTFLLLGLGMATFGSGTPVSKVVTDGFPVFVASFLRMLLAAAALIPLMLLARRGRPGWERAVPRIPLADWARLAAIAIAALAALGATVLFAPLAALQLGEVGWSAIDSSEWVALAWWGLGTMAIGSALWYAGVAKAPGLTASAFMGVMPVSAIALSYLLLGESFEWIHLVGMTAVLGGIAALVQSERAPRRR